MRAFKWASCGVLCCATLAMVLGCTVKTAEEDTTNTFITVIDLAGVPASQTGTVTDDLFSDVCDNSAGSPTFPTGCIAVNDFGQVTMRATGKNLTPQLGPSIFNDIVFNRYRVTFTRADGRNTPGVDVPHPFDGVMNFFVEVDGGDFTVAFTLVRQQAKLEKPIINLAGNGGAIVISTLARVDFYGQDTAGRAIAATGYLNVTFGDF